MSRTVLVVGGLLLASFLAGLAGMRLVFEPFVPAGLALLGLQWALLLAAAVEAVRRS